MDTPPASTRYLLGRAMLGEERIRTLLAHRRGHDPAPDDPFRGLYLCDEVVDAIRAHTQPPPETSPQVRSALEERADASEADGVELRLRTLARSASLPSKTSSFWLSACFRTSTPVLNGSTATSTTTSQGAGQPWGWRWNYRISRR
jgi:hypothetical protein